MFIPIVTGISSSTHALYTIVWEDQWVGKCK